MIRKLTAWMLIAFLCMNCAAAAPALSEADKAGLCAALYPYVPDNGRFESAVRAEWDRVHPDIPLSFVPWDCYLEDPSESADVFAFDAAYLALYVQNGWLQPIPEDAVKDRDDLLPFALHGCTVDGVLYAVPQLACTDILYTRKGDRELTGIRDIPALYRALSGGADGELLVDLSDNTALSFMYLDALSDHAGQYLGPDAVPDWAAPSMEALETLRDISRMAGPGARDPSAGGDLYERARRFAQGEGRAYIGYTEALSEMEGTEDTLEIRPYSYSDLGDVPVIGVDAAGIRPGLPADRLALALDLLDILTGSAAVTAAIAPDETHPVPQYLLPARLSAYGILEEKVPVYGLLREIVTDPDNRMLSRQADIREFLREASLALPPLVFD